MRCCVCCFGDGFGGDWLRRVRRCDRVEDGDGCLGAKGRWVLVALLISK